MKLLLVLPLVAVVFSGCATNSQSVSVAETARSLPSSQRQAYYDSQLKQGAISQREYDAWSAGNNRAVAKEKHEAAEWASMTPYERKQIELRRQELAVQEQQLIAQRAQAYAASAALTQQAMSSANATLGNQQVVTAINSR